MNHNPVYATYACDSFGRNIFPSKEDIKAFSAKPPKKRYVGLFYFLWVGQQGEKHTDVYDIEKLLQTDKEALWDPKGPKKAPLYMNYFFAQPLYGYYNMADPYILRKHIEFFIAADIDFIALDYTNALVYENVWPELFRLLEEYRLAGWKVPQFTFLAKTRSDWVVSYMYDHVYSQNLYPKLWFYGPYDKPFIVAPKDSLTEEQKNFFYVRDPQWPNEPRDDKAFPYMDWTRPQTVYENVMSVSVAQHSAGAFSFSGKMLNFACGTENKGRGYSSVTGCNNKDDINKCVNFIEQWDHAVNTDPEIVFVTGWNEWTALKLIHSQDLSASFWVDTFNVEFSRDIEMTKGYYDDNYYLQLIKQVRRYKGIFPPLNWWPETTLSPDSPPAQWKDKGCSYPNIATKKIARDHMGYIPKIHYTQKAPDNFIKEIRVAHDRDNIYFLITTDKDITKPLENNTSWMNLFIGIASGDIPKYSWEGFHYVLNRHSPGSLEKFGPKGFEYVSSVRNSVLGTCMQLEIPLKLLSLDKDSFSIRFKVADSITHPEDMMDYYVSGDTVPLGRLSYIYGNVDHFTC